MNGWSNYETWNVALWIQNDEGLYEMARMVAPYGYKEFCQTLKENDIMATPDGVRWDDATLDIEELDEMMAEL